jgi:hypothetical protein
LKAGARRIDVAAVGSTAAELRAWIESGASQSASGAFAAWVDAATGGLAHDYPEITGYALSFLAGQPSLSEDVSAVGCRAAAWLVDRVRRGNLAARDDMDKGAVYLFDIGMIASGLMSFGRRTQREELEEVGLQLVAFIDSELTEGDGLSAIARGARPRESAWSTAGVAHLAKLAQCFLLSGQFASSGCITRLVAAVKKLQQTDGRLLTHPDDPFTMLHPHLYAAEGLWVWGHGRGDDDSLKCGRVALDWAFAQQLESGGFPRAVAHDRQSHVIEQSDVTAQAVRLALLLDRRTPAVDHAIARLVQLTRRSERHLSLAYQPTSPRVHLNTWTTIFAAQALTLAVPGTAIISWRELV